MTILIQNSKKGESKHASHCTTGATHKTVLSTHSVLTYVGVRITAEWRGAAPTSGLGVVLGLYKPKPKPKRTKSPLRVSEH
jgi:hypothetical protein